MPVFTVKAGAPETVSVKLEQPEGKVPSVKTGTELFVVTVSVLDATPQILEAEAVYVVFAVGVTGRNPDPVTQVADPSVTVLELTEDGILSVVVEPGHTVFRLALRLMLTGDATCVEITLLLAHPFRSVPCTVSVVLAVGVNTGIGPLADTVLLDM
jgi:hypothetical protein